MAVLLLLRVPELSPGRYDNALSQLELDDDPPAGLILHLASEGTGAMNVIEVWQTAEAAESFIEQRLRPVLERNHVRQPLAYRLEPMRNLFPAQMDMIERIGATSVPLGTMRHKTLRLEELN